MNPGWDFDNTWRIYDGQSYPVLRWQAGQPILSAVGVSGATGTAATLAATSDLDGNGYWIVVARNATAPTSAQVKAATTYSGVTLAASGVPFQLRRQRQRNAMLGKIGGILGGIEAYTHGFIVLTISKPVNSLLFIE